MADPFDDIDFSTPKIADMNVEPQAQGTLPRGEPATLDILGAVKLFAAAKGIPAEMIDALAGNLVEFGEAIEGVMFASRARDEAAILSSTLAAARDARAIGADDLADFLTSAARKIVARGFGTDPTETAGG